MATTPEAAEIFRSAEWTQIRKREADQIARNKTVLVGYYIDGLDTDHNVYRADWLRVFKP